MSRMASAGLAQHQAGTAESEHDDGPHDMSCGWRWVTKGMQRPQKTLDTLGTRVCLDEYFAFISIRKEAINKIQIDSRSKNEALSSDKNFLFRKLTLPNSAIAEFAFLRNPFRCIPVSKLEWLNSSGVMGHRNFNFGRGLCQISFLRNAPESVGQGKDLENNLQPFFFFWKLLWKG